MAPAIVALALALPLLGTRHGWSADAPRLAKELSARSRPAGQTMRIDVRGAVAHVTVSRSMSCASVSRSGGIASTSTTATGATDAVLDIALPAGAALLDVTIKDDGRPQLTKPVAFATARAAYRESLRAWGISGSEVPFEEETTVRVRVACNQIQASKNIDLQYTFTALLKFVGARFRLAFPAAAEMTPPATHVEVRAQAPGGFTEISIAGATHVTHDQPKTGDSQGARILQAAETVTTRNPWVVSFLAGPARSRRADFGNAQRLVALTSVAARRGRPLWIAYAAGTTTGPPRDLPARVLFLIDRSRSVGSGGLEGERDAARRLLESMPPSTRFDALFFDRAVTRLFPVARAATRETIAALDDEMVPARMGNGTDLTGVLRAARDLLKREADDFSPRCLLVLLTDGAVGAPDHVAELPALLTPPAGIELSVAVVSIRPNDDPPVSADERHVLRGLAAAEVFASVERSVKRAGIADDMPSLLDALRSGGDVYGISFSKPPAGADRPGGNVIEVLAPGEGASGVLRSPISGTRAFTFRGSSRSLPVLPVAVEERWLEPLAIPRPVDARLLISPGLSALVEPVIPTATSLVSSADTNLNPAGYMERSVVRDALSLAFTPRARACYLNRAARTAAERDLTGRVRLALDLVRGEVAGVRIESTTLAYPAIETCLRDAAYAIEVPRAYRNDEAVTAVLNLVFRPRTPDRRTAEYENPSISHEIDMMVEAALKDTRAPSGASLAPTVSAPVSPWLPPTTAAYGPDAATPDGSR